MAKAIAVRCRVHKGGMPTERSCGIKILDGSLFYVLEQAIRIWHTDWSPVLDGELQKSR